MVWVETPDQPDAEAGRPARHRAECRERGILTVCDNTFASPIVQRPLELGIDIVVHSTTKYMNGHSDVIGGVAVVGTEPRTRRCANGSASSRTRWARSRGRSTASWCCAASRPWPCASNAATRMRWIWRSGWNSSRRSAVHYPGLASHPQHELARRQMHGYGGIISIDLDTDLAGARRFLEHAKCSRWPRAWAAWRA
jgi:cystathionine gamma-lyase